MNIEFMGLIREKEKLFKYIRNARLFVFPSYSENMSIMLLEAASLKVPVICSDIPENKTVFNEKEVLFFKSENEDDLAEKLKYALANSRIMEKYTDNRPSDLSKIAEIFPPLQTFIDTFSKPTLALQLLRK